MASESEVIEKMKGIIDPHTASDVSLTFMPSSPFCPLGVQLAVAIKKGLKEIGVEKADAERGVT